MSHGAVGARHSEAMPARLRSAAQRCKIAGGRYGEGIVMTTVARCFSCAERCG
jgi:hypothetical protein